MDSWLTSARDALAEAAGVPREELELDDATVATLLEIARRAARESDDRRNAPLLCYLAGRVAGRVDVDAVARTLDGRGAAG